MKEEYKGLYQQFGLNVVYYRKKKRLSQEKLAELTDLSLSYIKQIESKREFKNVTFTTLEKIAKALNISISDLFN